MNTKINQLAEIPTKELLSKRKKIIGAAIALGIVSIIAFVIIFYIAITKEKYGLLGITGGISIAFFIILISLNQVEKEINLRNVNESIN